MAPEQFKGFYLYSVFNIIRRMRRAGHVALMAEKRIDRLLRRPRDISRRIILKLILEK
jgi:hypothetical protein